MRSFARLFGYFIQSWIDWMFRRRSSAMRMIAFGVVCLALAFGGGYALSGSFPFRSGRVDFDFGSSGGTPALLLYIAAIVGVSLIGAGLAAYGYQTRLNRKRLSRKKVIVVEARGLRDTTGSPLSESLSPKLAGQRQDLLLDFRQRVKDGEIVSPEAALDHFTSLPTDFRCRENGSDRRDVSWVYGGLAPVPFTFLTGVLFDDETSVHILDWDRHASRWRELGDADDGKRFTVSGLDDTTEESSAVALAVSVSYAVDTEAIRAKLGPIPIVKLDLKDGSPDCHWSEEKQRALGKQFLQTAIALGNRAVKRIHLFLAAQNSIVFRFGKLYDKRNLPEVVVYQYQRAATSNFPWGILMPVCGVDKPAVLRSHAVCPGEGQSHPDV
ncbi:MAG: SAVED domain-containing protein [Rhodospirillaceae bacterium]|nr:SAVED domain-containing protein [Rhodospirillaceae bacterium]